MQPGIFALYSMRLLMLYFVFNGINELPEVGCFVLRNDVVCDLFRSLFCYTTA